MIKLQPKTIEQLEPIIYDLLVTAYAEGELSDYNAKSHDDQIADFLPTELERIGIDLDALLDNGESIADAAYELGFDADYELHSSI